MPAIKGRRENGRILIDVGVQPTLEMPTGVTPEHTPTSTRVRSFRGLVDTGADVTCITRSAASEIGLIPRGKRRIGNVSSWEMHTNFSFAVGVWYGSTYHNDDTATGYYQFEPVFGVDFKDHPEFDVLLGMDVIGQGDFSIKRNGEFVWELG